MRQARGETGAYSVTGRLTSRDITICERVRSTRPVALEVDDQSLFYAQLVPSWRP